MNILENNVERILVSEEKIAELEDRMAKQISEEYVNPIRSLVN